MKSESRSVVFRLFLTPWTVPVFGILQARILEWIVTLRDPMDYTVHGILQARVLEWVAFPFSRDLPNPGIEPRSLASQADFFLPAEPQGKPKNTGVGSLSLPQRSFLTQKLNWCLLHSRQILYQLSYQGSPDPWESPVKCRFGHTQGRPSSPLLREARERGRGHIKLVSSWRKLRRMQLIFSVYLSIFSLFIALFNRGP